MEPPPPDAQARVQSEALDVTRTLNELRRALGARLFGGDDQELSWEEARQAALHPRPEFRLAKEIVERVRESGEVDEAWLRSQFAGGRHSAFEQALAIAAEDGHVEASPQSRWRVTTFADQQLVDSDDVRVVEDALVAHVGETGWAERDELALSVGVPEFSSALFLEALEQALASGAIERLGPGLYGVPPADLAHRSAPPARPPTDDGVDRRRTKAILTELAREIGELRLAVARERRAPGASQPRLPTGPRPPWGRTRRRRAGQVRWPPTRSTGCAV